jgi:deoxyhypusine synthase
LSEAVGGVHYKYNPAHSDEELYRRGYNRVYDTLEMESNLWESEKQLEETFKDVDWSKPTCSSDLCRIIGQRLSERGMMPSVLGCAYERGVPVYIPAFTDSELALDIATSHIAENENPKTDETIDDVFNPVPNYNPFLDMYDFAKRLMKATRIGIFTIGGGVPRNWGQQVAPFIEILNRRCEADLYVPRFCYGVRICPEPVHWGGLSGCTYSEGISWGKFVSPREGGRFAEVLCDATIAWPLLIRAAIEKLAQGT